MTVPESMEGERFDAVLARLAGVSRSMARRLIESGEAGLSPPGGTVPPDRPGARRIRLNTRVAAGFRTWFRLPEEPALGPEPIPLAVLYEDQHLAVIDKPAGLVVHPGSGNPGGTLVSALLHRWPEVEGVGEHPRWGIVHRLDKDTSGALAVARRPEAHRGLSAALAARRVQRSYLALVHGAFSADTGTIDAPIDRRRARRFVGPDGKPAVTHYRRLAARRRPDISLLEVTLETGRTHQIRVHLESIGRPVVGDAVYGRPGRGGEPPLGRPWLHARRLSFAHPITGTPVEAEAPLPPELRAYLDALAPFS